MADPRDASLEQAQSEIQRRLLRHEKLKHIEEEEMRRLGGTGWRPPKPTPAAGGPSVHAAAQAIETMEDERAALRAEARRRLMERQGELQRILEQFRAIENTFREGGLTRAADMWKHYLDGNGDPVAFAAEDMRAYDVMKDAEGAIDRYFIEWMTGPPDAAGWERIGSALLAMQDGETLYARSNWDSGLDFDSLLRQIGMGWRTVFEGMGPTEDLFGFLGASQLSGNGGFTFTRHGDVIDFEGTVTYGFNEPFNFEAGRDFRDPGNVTESVRGADGELLQREGLAKVFDMRSHWTRRVHGRLRVVHAFRHGPRLALDGQPVWTDVDPSERWP